MINLLYTVTIALLVIQTAYAHFAVPAKELEASHNWAKTESQAVIKSTMVISESKNYFLSVDIVVSKLASKHYTNYESSYDIVFALRVTTPKALRGKNNFVDLTYPCSISRPGAVFECLYMVKIPRVARSPDANSMDIELLLSPLERNFSSPQAIGVQFSIHATVVSLPFVFSSWMGKPLTDSVVDCIVAKFASQTTANSLKVGVLRVSDDGRVVKIDRQHIEKGSGDAAIYDFRAHALELGVEQAVEYARQKWEVKNFPSLKAVVYLADDSPIDSLKSVATSCGSIPILSHFSSGYPFVILPDSSYFAEDVGLGVGMDGWFGQIELERSLVKKDVLNDRHFERGPFASKYAALVYRDSSPILGNVGTRLKQLVMSCEGTGAGKKTSHLRLDVGSEYQSLEEMCGRYQGIISLPETRGWSWTAKYLLMCNSVSILVPPEDIGGDTWETRSELGLRPWVHYLPLTNDPNTVCDQLSNLTSWIGNNPVDAEIMAYRSRAVVLQKLNQGAVLHDLAALLLDYAMLYQDKKSALHADTRLLDTGDERYFEPTIMRMRQDRFASVRVDWSDSTARLALTDAEAMALAPDPVDEFQAGTAEQVSGSSELEWRQREAEAAATKLSRHAIAKSELFDSTGSKPWLPQHPRHSAGQRNRTATADAGNTSDGAVFKPYSNPYRTRGRRRDRNQAHH